MTKLIYAAALGVVFATGAYAQSGAPAKSTAAVKAAHTVNDGAPEAGRSSFTEAQAREHIVKSGFASVSPLTKGDDGVWRGTARKGGRTLAVALDFKGNVSTAAR